MRIQTGDLFNPPQDKCLYSQVPAICIPTNGIIRRDGLAVMGRGVALEAARRQPWIQAELADCIKKYGNIVSLLQWPDTARFPYHLVSFPTKNHWKENSDILLIQRSAWQLTRMADDYLWNQVCLPPVGCGNGGLRWKDVEAVLAPILDDRFVVLFKEK